MLLYQGKSCLCLSRIARQCFLFAFASEHMFRNAQIGMSRTELARAAKLYATRSSKVARKVRTVPWRYVRSIPTSEPVVAIATVERIVTVTSVAAIGPAAAFEEVVSCASNQPIIAFLPPKPIIIVTTS